MGGGIRFDRYISFYCTPESLPEELIGDLDSTCYFKILVPENTVNGEEDIVRVVYEPKNGDLGSLLEFAMNSSAAHYKVVGNTIDCNIPWSQLDIES